MDAPTGRKWKLCVCRVHETKGRMNVAKRLVGFVDRTTNNCIATPSKIESNNRLVVGQQGEGGAYIASRLFVLSKDLQFIYKSSDQHSHPS